MRNHATQGPAASTVTAAAVPHRRTAPSGTPLRTRTGTSVAMPTASHTPCSQLSHSTAAPQSPVPITAARPPPRHSRRAPARANATAPRAACSVRPPSMWKSVHPSSCSSSPAVSAPIRPAPIARARDAPPKPASANKAPMTRFQAASNGTPRRTSPETNSTSAQPPRIGIRSTPVGHATSIERVGSPWAPFHAVHR